MIYKQEIEVPSYLCDVEDRLHTWAAIRLCQEVTEYHGNATGIGFKTLLAQNRAWVITHAYYNVYRLPSAFEKIMLSTWSRGHNGLIAYRDYRMVSAEGEVLMTGTSCWPMIDMTTRRVLRLNELIEGYENHPQCATQYEKLSKLRLPTFSEQDVRLRRMAAFAMLDHTQHVNNSEYVRMIFDCLADMHFETTKPFSVEINYALETHQHEEMSLCCTKEENSYWFEIKNPRGISAGAVIKGGSTNTQL